MKSWSILTQTKLNMIINKQYFRWILILKLAYNNTDSYTLLQVRIYDQIVQRAEIPYWSLLIN